MELSIATGPSRKTKVWKNKKVTWDALVKRLSDTVRTPETYKEYCAYGKEKQAEIKDRGGFVGGYLKEGKRSPGTVLFRQVLTLDLDFAHISFWNDFKLFYDNAAVCHSTHKHSLSAPRFRLIMPLDRPVTAEQYEAIARKIAGCLDINIFDPTTFQPERLMYWPTSSKNADYFFKEQTGPVLCADEILDTYVDWTDISAWPKPDSEKDLIHSHLKKQGAPGEKPGLIGAFCRAYPISRSIEDFLPEIYEPCDVDNRYTYSEGSAAAGAIVYGDDEFLYSHHGTDPIHGLLVNSFDLVRLHKFGAEDDEGSDKEISKRKSQKLMTDFASSIAEVVKEVGVRALPADVFDDEYGDKWLGELTVDKYGKYDNTIPNFEKIVNNDSNLKNRLRYDLFNYREVIVCPIPWDKSEGPKEFTDADAAELRNYLEDVYQIYHATKTKDALDIIFRRNQFNPVRDYLDELDWDGVPRLDTMLIDYLGADDTTFTRLATRKALVAAVARIYRPGCKFDYVLTLVGKQGIGKSSIFSKLGGDWFSDSFVGVEGTKSFEQLHGAWLIEIAELAGIRKAETEAVKHFVSKQEDRFRVAYGDRVSTFKRQCVFFGTTNEDKFLRDYTGNRRYWPITVTGFGDFEIEDMPIADIWAEAKKYYFAGEKLYFDADTEEEAYDIQKYHTETDDRAGLISNYLKTPLPTGWDNMSLFERRSYLSDRSAISETGEVDRLAVCVAEIWAEVFRAEPKDMDTHRTKYIHQILAELPGWEKSKSNLTFPIYGKQRAYVVNASVRTHNKRKAERKK